MASTSSAPFVSAVITSESLASKHGRYESEGFCFIRGFLTAEALGYLRERVAHVWSHMHADVQRGWIMNLHQVLPREDNWMWKLATDPRILEIVRMHYGPDFVFNSSQILVKPPTTEDAAGGREVPWHQDGQIIRTLWICLDDVDETNGGLVVKPGWHTRGNLRKRVAEHPEQCLQGTAQYAPGQASKPQPGALLKEIDIDAYCPEGGRAEWESGTVQYRLKAGDCAMHHPSVPHRSLPNASADAWRRIIILRYLPARFPRPAARFHQHWESAVLFEKESFLVSGDDVGAQGMRRTPWEECSVPSSSSTESSDDAGADAVAPPPKGAGGGAGGQSGALPLLPPK